MTLSCAYDSTLPYATLLTARQAFVRHTTVSTRRPEQRVHLQPTNGQPILLVSSLTARTLHALTVPARFCAVEAIANFASSLSFNVLEGNVNAIALFNHEEIGSVSTTGAESSIIPFLLQRLSPTPAAYAQSVSRSFLVSADMGHAVHPNYKDKHEDNHAPAVNGGVVIKTNAKQRYATDAIGTFVGKHWVEKKGGKVQEFEVRNDM